MVVRQSGESVHGRRSVDAEIRSHPVAVDGGIGKGPLKDGLPQRRPAFGAFILAGAEVVAVGRGSGIRRSGGRRIIWDDPNPVRHIDCSGCDCKFYNKLRACARVLPTSVP